MNFKAVCTDIDGTLLDSRRELSDVTIQTIKSIPDEIPVILASSRMPSAMRHLQQELGILHFPLICYNGGYVIHYSNGATSPQVLQTTEIKIDLCKKIAALANGTDIHVSLYREDKWLAPAFDQWTERESRITKVPARVVALDAALRQWEEANEGAHKIMCMGPEAEIENMQQKLAQTFGDVIHIYRSRPTYLELAPREISKASALTFVLQKIYQLNLKDVIAFGDNYNDVEMIEQAGWGVAVANARDEVKAVANEITADSKADGVAGSLKKYF